MNPTALAHRLHDARLRRRPIGRLTDEVPLDEELAYRIQAEGIRLRLEDGERIVGAKLGFTSRAMRRAMGVDHPNYGILTDAMACTSPVSPSTFIHPKVEPEIAFLLEADLGPHATTADVLAATAAVAPCLEIVDSRFRDFSFTALDNIADDSSAAGFVLGPRVPVPEDLRLVGVVLEVDGEVAATAAGAAAADHPATAVAWAARRLAAAGTPLEAGMLVISGGLTAPVDLVPGRRVRCIVDRIGTVELREE
ncbi:MAG TPA: 4-oxalocrotonate decarboxylase [Actinobacteria bacterium]|nr:4-oxalocrotonate decarboxylase [Actinomycetota bacterium]